MIPSKLKELRKKKKLTLDDLAKKIGTSRQTIHRYETGVITNIPPEKVEMLAEILETTPAVLMGWADFDMNQYSNLSPASVRKVPMLGEIACGEPVYADQQHGEFATCCNNIDADFCLRASGDSMINARVHDGDIVFIKSQSSVDNGEIAAVIIDDEATLKRVYYYPESSKVILCPENPKYAPLVYTGEELNSVKIIGKAIAFQSELF